MANLSRRRVTGNGLRGPGKALIAMVALICLTAGYFLGNYTQWAHEGVAGEIANGSSGATDVQAIHKSLGSSNSGSSGSGSSSGSTGSSMLGTAKVKTVCDDSCAGFAKNGVCDDGRPNASGSDHTDPLTIYTINCDLGTDCSDCGPWVHNNTDASDAWKPIAGIKAKKFEVFTRQVQHPTRYWMAFTDGAKDVDVSAQLKQDGLLEKGFTFVWHRVLHDGCRGPNGEQRLALDVGANFGYYTLLSVAMGCRVVAWEPVPYFADYFKYALLRNNFTHAVELRENIVSNTTGGTLTMVVPNRGIWGTAGIGGANIDGAVHNEGDYDHIERSVERVDGVIHEDALIMKIDVEGYEPSVLQGSRDLLLKHTVENIIMEYSPGVPERNHKWEWFESTPRALFGLVRGGYTIVHLADMAKEFPNWESKDPFPPLEEVTDKCLKNDIEDAWRLLDGTMGCHKAAAEIDLKDMFNCNSVPEGFHPHSFRATFGHNTNIWAFKTKPWFAAVGEPASLAPLDYDVQHEFFIPGGKVGAARRICAHLPPHLLIPHRCPCPDNLKDKCGDVAERIKRVAKEGQLPPFAYDNPQRPWQPEKLGIDSW